MFVQNVQNGFVMILTSSDQINYAKTNTLNSDKLTKYTIKLF